MVQLDSIYAAVLSLQSGAHDAAAYRPLHGYAKGTAARS